MEFMKEKVLKTILVPILIMMLTMGQGISIAMGEVRETLTNVKNVEFAVSLKQEEEETKISSKPVLVLDVEVKDKGVLNEGKIKIENANFTIRKDQIQNSYIKNVKVEENEIELNSIVYSNRVTLEIPIQFKKQEEREEDYFQREMLVTLSGSYKDETVVEVKAERKIQIHWTEDAEIVLSQEMKKFKRIENVGTLLQQEITTEVLENRLPRESENLLVQVPKIEEQQPQKIYVIKNGVKIADEQIVFDKETNVLEMKDEKSLTWGKQQNVYDIIYLYDLEVPVKETTIELNTLANTKLATKEAIQKQETKEVTIQEMGNVVSLRKEISQEVYKGYLMARAEQETIFTEKNTLQISNAEAIDQIELEKVSEEFTDNVDLFNVSEYTTYKNTTVDKEELERILGNDGQITVTDEAGNVLGQLSKDNLTIEYETPVKNIKLTTTKPVTEGNLSIHHTRTIKSEQPYNREQVKTFVKMITKTKVISNQAEEVAEAELLLKDTKTEAKLEISNPNLSTLQKNENVQFLVTLKSDSWEYDLYKNPFVRMVLPGELSVEIKNVTQLNVQEELASDNPVLYENEAGEKVIEIQLKGEQTRFENSINEGIQIAITADITIDKTTPSKASEITMNYTNENRAGEEFKVVVPIQLNSKYGVLTVNKLSQYNSTEDSVENIDDKIKEVALEEGAEARKARQEIAIVNNYENEITDVVVMGKIPNKGQEEINGETLQATFEMNLAEAVQVEGDRQVYYAENPKEDKDSEAWTTTPEDFTKVRAFKLQLENNTLQPQEVLKMSYPLTIQEKLEENEESYTNLEVSYHYLGDTVDTNSTICFKTAKQENNEIRTENTEGMSIELQGRTGGKPLAEGQEVYEGQAIKYILKITNHSKEEIKNLKVNAIQENAIFYDKKVYHDGWDSITGEEGVAYTKIEENPELTQKELTIESIAVGESLEVEYQFSVKEVESETEMTTGKISITADGLENKEIETLKNPIKQGKLKLQMRNKSEEEYKMFTNREYPFFLDVTNISGVKQKDILVHLPVPEGFDFETASLFEADNYEFIEYKEREIILKIPSLEVNQTISIRLGFQIKSMDTKIESKDYHFTYQAVLGKETYVSNEMDRTIYNAESDIEAKQYGSIRDEWVKNGDALTFTCEIENKGIRTQDIDITDYVPMGAEIQKAMVKKYDMSEEPLKLLEEKEIGIISTQVSYNSELQANEKIVLTIDTIINTDKIFSKEITNNIVIYGLLQEIPCSDLTYKVKGKEEIKDPEVTYNIQGIAWVDENKNGLREESEKRLDGITVFLMEEKTGEIASEVQTNENGEYQFENLKQDNYFVVFQYDATQYRVTEYQKTGISHESNSDVINKTILLQGKEQTIAMTGTLELTNGDLNHIDAGFIQGEKFDLKLDKSISRVIIQNNKGTTVKQFNQAKLAKIELDSKQINNSNVIIEYSIRVTNEGELAGYVNEIIDDKPADLSFSSEMNTNWYQTTNGNVCSRELNNQLLAPGETKTIRLTLIKNMNQDNTGTIINTAKINKASNDYRIQDSNEENDRSTAEVIISINTGMVIMYLSLMLSIIMIIGVGIYMIKKKVLRKE